MKKLLLILMVCCVVTATAVFATSTQSNLISTKSCTKKYPGTLYNKTTKKCVCANGIKRKRKTKCNITTTSQGTGSINTGSKVSTSSLLSTGSKPVFGSGVSITGATTSGTQTLGEICTGSTELFTWIYGPYTYLGCRMESGLLASSWIRESTQAEKEEEKKQATYKACISSCVRRGQCYSVDHNNCKASYGLGYYGNRRTSDPINVSCAMECEKNK